MDAVKKLNVEPLSIGHSSGWLQCRFGYSRNMQTRVIAQSDASAIELVSSPLDGYYTEQGLDFKKANRFEHVSVHLPNMSGFSKVSKTNKKIIGKSLVSYFSKLECNNATIHADSLDKEKITWLKEHGVPISVENTSRNNISGKLPHEVIAICRDQKVPLVLDLQHAYEVSCDLYGPDAYFEVAEQFARLAKKYTIISQLHVSGEVSYLGNVVQNHASLLFATNRSQILDCLVRVNNILGGNLPPIILEGDYLPGLESRIYKKVNMKKHAEMAVTNMNFEMKVIFDALGRDFAETVKTKVVV